MKNTKEVALVQVRYGREAELPEALHQGEIGLAWDTNRLFIGNKANTDLKNRIEYPYKNLEILTEYSDMNEILTYTYLNNIDNLEKLPIVVVSTNTPQIDSQCDLGIQTSSASGSITLTVNETLENIVSSINNENIEGIRAYINEENKLVLVAYDSKLLLSGNSALVQMYLIDSEDTNSENLPERYVRNKLDDFVTTADFGIVGDITDVSEKFINSLLELYNKNTFDEQYFRTYKILAGRYSIAGNQTIPLLSNMHLKGDGIDKTVFVIDNSFGGNNVFTSTDTTLDYNNGKPAFNTIIEDMTIDMSSISTYNGYLLLLNRCNDITFRNVKFIGNINLKFANILNSTNIIFENCIIENFYSGILGSGITRLFLRNNIFNTSYDYEVKLNNSIGLTMNSNTFISSAQTSGSIIDISNNCSYSTIIQSNFDSDVISNYPKLFNRVLNDYTNYIDTLDASTNERKLLKFKFLQPQWEYIDYLTNQNGKTAVVVDNSQYKTNSQDYPLADNTLNIDTTNGLKLENLGEDDLILKSSQSSDVVIGDYDEIIGNIGQIQVKKNIQLNNNIISNSEGNGPIIIETAENGIIEVGDNTTGAPYEQRILGNDNAIPNVAYVNRAANTTKRIFVSTEDAENFTQNGLELFNFDPLYYGNTIYLKNIKMNVKIPFLSMFKYMNSNDSILYTSGYYYYKGDIVTDGTNYGVVKENHEATTSLTLSTSVQIISSSNLKDIKYAEIVAVNNLSAVNSYYLTKELEGHGIGGYSVVEADTRNDRGENPPPVAIGTSSKYFTENSVAYETTDDVRIISSKLDLHDRELFVQSFLDGNIYSFNFDRPYIPVEPEVALSDEMNFSNYKLYLRFYDEDDNLITPVALDSATAGNSYTKMNPVGKLIIDIEYIRG